MNYGLCVPSMGQGKGEPAEMERPSSALSIHLLLFCGENTAKQD